MYSSIQVPYQFLNNILVRLFRLACKSAKHSNRECYVYYCVAHYVHKIPMISEYSSCLASLLVLGRNFLLQSQGTNNSGKSNSHTSSTYSLCNGIEIVQFFSFVQDLDFKNHVHNSEVIHAKLGQKKFLGRLHYLQVGPNDEHVIYIKIDHHYLSFSNFDIQTLVKFTESILIAMRNSIKYLVSEFWSLLMTIKRLC